MYAFSVFTHLSERATLSALRTLRKYVSPDGVLVITIRPVEYWAVDKAFTEDQRQALKRQHEETGFAFHPHRRDAVDGDITYGDTSLTIEWLSAKAPEWSVQRMDRSLEDPLQVYVFLTPSGEA
jgi:hypothetical protein